MQAEEHDFQTVNGPRRAGGSFVDQSYQRELQGHRAFGLQFTAPDNRLEDAMVFALESGAMRA